MSDAEKLVDRFDTACFAYGNMVAKEASGSSQESEYVAARQAVLAALTLTWTTARPTREGWWWYRGPETLKYPGSYPSGSTIMKVSQNDEGFYTDFGDGVLDEPFVAELDGEWAGPLVPPHSAPLAPPEG